MKIKKGLDVCCSDFWYDLTSGGYLKPEQICEHEADAQMVLAAIVVLQDFEDSCDEQIEGFCQ